MITLHYSGSNTAIITAVKKANEILSNDTFYEKIAALPQMSNTKLSSPDIAEILKETDQKVTVMTYRNPFGSVARTIQPYKFKVNTSKISSVTAFAVNTLVHQTIHAIDFLGNKLDVTHFDNNYDGEGNTLPWKIGEIAEIISRKARRFA